MSGTLVRGVTPASFCFVVACFGIFNSLDLVFVAASALLIWLLVTAVRLAMEIARGSYKSTANSWDRESFRFWLVALLSSLLAPVFYLVLVGLALSHHEMP
jgi:hypothetical protein